MSLQAYALIFEGIMILVLLSWEIFWLRRVWKVLNNMWGDIEKNTETFRKIAEIFDKPRDRKEAKGMHLT